MTKCIIILSIILLTAPSLSSANEKINNHYDEYNHLTGLLGLTPVSSRYYRSFSNNNFIYEQQSGNLWNINNEPESSGKIFSIIDPDLKMSYNTKIPFGSNDGGQWQGKGLNSVISTGVIVKPWLFTFILYPDVWYAENKEFPIIAGVNNPYGDYGVHLDRPQRFGDKSLYEIDWGQSGIRFDYRKFTIGFSTENFWVGPSIKNSLLMSNNAAGFPHIDVGTNKPVNTFLGDFEATFIWGQLKESDYYDQEPENNYNLFVGCFLQYSPSFIPGFSFGFNRAFTSPWETIDTFKVFQQFDTFFKDTRWKKFDSPTGDDDVDQLVSFVFNWNLKENALNLFCELGYNDHKASINDFLINPEHAVGITVGFKKAYNLFNKYLLIEGEYTEIGNNQTTSVPNSPRPTGSWYRHDHAGYTNNGQLLGAAIGPGSNSQYMGVIIYYTWGNIGAYGQRIAIDNDYFLSTPDPEFTAYNIEIIGGLKGVILAGNFDFFYDLSMCHNYNNSFIHENNVNNYRIEIGSRYKI